MVQTTTSTENKTAIESTNTRELKFPSSGGKRITNTRDIAQTTLNLGNMIRNFNTSKLHACYITHYLQCSGKMKI